MSAHGRVARCFHPRVSEGREFVVVANDVTYQSGSFGVKEDALC